MNKNTIARFAFILAASTFMAGCAPMISGVMNATTDENSAAEKIASYFGARRENVVITSTDKGLLATTYQVKHAGKIYNCSIYYGQVECKQPGGESNGRVDSSPAPAGGGQPTTAMVVAANDNGITPAQAQARLNQLGYAVGVPDGVFGKKSVEKLKLFQKSRGLVVSGKLDEPTVNALR